MKHMAFIFSYAPHGTAFGREGLDLILSASLTIQNISIFFIGDGIFQLIKNQKPEYILSRNYTPAFCILPLYGINKFYFCSDSLIERGIFEKDIFLLDIQVLSKNILQRKLDKCDGIINF